MFFLNGMLITSNNSIDSRYWDIAKHKILQQEVLWYSTVTVVSTWQDELVSCWEAIYCWCRCQFVNCYHTPNLSMPLYSYTECRTLPILFCNHYYYELFMKPGECAATFANPSCIIAEVLKLLWPSMFSLEQSLQTYVWNFRVSIYWYTYGIYPPFPSKAKGLDYPSTLQFTLLPILQIL